MPFVQLYQEHILGVLEGLDRIRFRGTDRMLSNTRGFAQALHIMEVWLKDFGDWADRTTRSLRQQCAEHAQRLGIPTVYLPPGGHPDKEALARRYAAEEGVAPDGSIVQLSAVEPCVAPGVHANRATKRLEVQMRPRRCVFLYHYFDHPQVGFGHVRLQTWAPYTVHICLNGRHWLEKQLQDQGIAYHKVGNCFPFIKDLAQAQALLSAQFQTDWPRLLEGLVKQAFPELFELCAPYRLQYYWSADETEYATDVLFRSASELDALFPHLVLHAMRISDCAATLRYLGQRGEQAKLGRAPRQVHTDCKKRHEGVRIKHWVNGNSVKMYNKAGRVLRVETTVNVPRHFKAFRAPNDDTTKPASWQPMRKGVSDLYRRAQVSAQSNQRYLEALSAACVEKTLHEAVKDACNPTVRNGRRARGLNPWNEADHRLLTFLAKGEWAVNGFRNEDVRHWLYSDAVSESPEARRKRSAHATRRIGLLRAHGLVRKVPKENRYVLTEQGQTFATALLTASNARVSQLTKCAA